MAGNLTLISWLSWDFFYSKLQPKKIKFYYTRRVVIFCEACNFSNNVFVGLRPLPILVRRRRNTKIRVDVISLTERDILEMYYCSALSKPKP